jgi:flagellar biosynthesis protein FlhG
LGNFHFDQAEGLRRMLAGPRPRIFTFLSATPEEEKGAMLVNLGASLAQGGSDVLLVDACHAARGIAAGIDALREATLAHVARSECPMDAAICQMPQGFGIAALSDMPLASGDAQLAADVTDAFEQLAARADIVIVDAEPGDDGGFPIAALTGGEIVVQVSTAPESITLAYSLIKRVSGHLGQRPFGVLVTGASEKDAQVVYRNMAQAANRYLGVKLNSMGSVPADEHVTRAARLGRAVVDAYPRAGASVAFRRLAGRFALADGAAELNGVASRAGFRT